MIRRALAALLLCLAIPFAASAQTIPTYTFATLPGSPAGGQLAWITDGAATPVPGTAEIGGGTHKDLIAYDATQLRWEFVQRAPDDTPPEELATFLSGARVAYDNTTSGAAADDVQAALDELFAGGGGGGGGGDNLGNGQATTNIDLNGNDLLEVDDLFLNGDLTGFRPVDQRTTGAGPISNNAFRAWYAMDGVFDATNKTRANGIFLDFASLTSEEGYGLYLDAVGGGDSDMVAVGVRAPCTGPASAPGVEGCQSLRTVTLDHWYEGAGSVSGTIPAGAGQRTLTITGQSIDTSRMLGEKKLFVVGAGTAIDLVDVPPGVLLSSGAFDSGDAAWSFDGSATNQGVWTVGAGQITGASIDPGDCFRANLTAHTPYLAGPTAYQWLRVVSTNPGANQLTTEWLGQGNDAKTPLGYRADEGLVGTEAVVAPCGQVVRPIFNLPEDYIADSVIVDFPAAFPGATNPTFVVPGYGTWRLRGQTSFVAQKLGGGGNGYGHAVSNDLQLGRFQIVSGYRPTFAGSLSSLVDGSRHALLYGFDCASTPGACQYGPSFRYLDDPSDENFLQAFGFVRFSDEDWGDDTHRSLIHVFNDPAQSITIHPTLGIGRNGDPFMRTSQLNTPNGAGPSTTGSGRLVEWSQIEGMPAGFADGSDDGSAGGATDLTGLTDVTLTTPATGAVLIKSGTDWIDGPIDLADLDAVSGILADANVADNITAANYLPLVGGTLTGSLTLSSGQAINVPTGAVVQATGTGAVYATNMVGSGSATTAVDFGTAEVQGLNLVANGGTGTNNLTNGGLILGTGFGAFRSTGVLGAGQILIGDGFTDPTIAALSGDVSMTSGGVVSLSTGSVDANELVATGASAGTYQSPTLTIDADGRITSAVQGTNILIASGSRALATAPIASGACSTADVGITATGVATTDAIAWTPNGDISGVTGYAPVTTGGLAIYPYPTANAVNFKVCNPTSASITPGSVTLNYRVTR